MSIIHSVILGILQGIAEFLPISSSGHLALARHFLELEDVPLLFDVFLHLATLCAVILFFRKTIARLFCAFGRMLLLKKAEGQEVEYRLYVAGVLIVTAITGCIGILVEKKLGSLPLRYICIGFIFTGLLLVISTLICKRLHDTDDKSQISPSLKQSIVIGLAQGIGTLPGVSRSGSTISAALLCGVTREVAGEFSFIASIPAILGAFILELKELKDVTSSIGIVSLTAGGITAFVSGIIALSLLMKLIKNGKLGWFACYLIPAGILGLLFL